MSKRSSAFRDSRGEWIGELGTYQRFVRSGRIGKLYFKLLYTLAQLHPAIFKSALRIYAADPAKLYIHPDFDNLLQATFPAFKKLDLEAMAIYFAAMPGVDISADLDRIQAPTLVMTGDRDPTVPPAQARLISERIPNADLVVIPDAGHLPPYENEEAYRQALEGWLVQTTG
jgi:pimeloyl-ACP methyl ester carboxylesterase